MKTKSAARVADIALHDALAYYSGDKRPAVTADAVVVVPVQQAALDQMYAYYL